MHIGHIETGVSKIHRLHLPGLARMAPPPVRRLELEGSPLHPGHTLARLVVGKSNLVAIEAARALARGRSGFTVAYICGGLGLGKTHLLQALCAEDGRAGIYLSCKDFAALAKKPGAIHALRRADFVAIDDVDLVQRSKPLQEKLGDFAEHGGRLLVAAQVPPHELLVSARLRSRLGAGMFATIDGFDDFMLADVIRGEAYRDGLELSEAVTQRVAGAIARNGRAAIGAMNRFSAHRRMMRTADLSTEVADELIFGLRLEDDRSTAWKITEIQYVVCRHFEVSYRDMLSARRTGAITWPRQVAMYLARATTVASFPEIGERFGGRDHTTVLHAYRKILDMMAGDTATAAEIEFLKRKLQ